MINSNWFNSMFIGEVAARSLNFLWNPRMWSRRAVSSGLLLTASLYVLLPSVSRAFNVKKGPLSIEESKRLDRFTTGLLNARNDCFLNSSLQALVPIESLTTYLNQFVEALHSVDEGQVFELERLAPLHANLIKLLHELQSLIVKPQTVSAKNIVKTLEDTLRRKMSSDQNDAHEFTQILLETLHSEYIKLQSNIEIGSFPFEGVSSNYLMCLQCNKYSQTIHSPFLMLEVAVPGNYSEKLTDLILHSQDEIIEGYSCLYCKVNMILKNEKYLNQLPEYSQEEQSILNFLRNQILTLYINDDLPADVSFYVDHYSKNGCVTANFKSNIIKKNAVIKEPASLIVHLSRSIFNGATITRSACRVEYEQSLNLQRQVMINDAFERTEPIKYELKSVVKHTGSHVQGHYQCYRKKPDLMKERNTDTIVNRSPMIKKYSQDKFDASKIESIITGTSKRLYKRIKSLAAYPYWHISDTNVKEARTTDVLSEDKYVYILYYEKEKP
ncbi:hypothetical protein KAFR_0E00930 [Kazachstania africana CBS 2517]|uniref:USP domain-containing protein n=1 Tax=Kazachstania africana (strain ATCC 22294 / BCRC 22015 / CBS 2517 / CECT 1963 / NBRC 1671 / NRRL Y-8276) TaxID=1071382 RepID=H2AV47_KAZAF|nr:hypothetical protein KAFR_0E00930 [Kazachstania africana CBS 2517]CCF58247.1 hypothetical protein KAFR_0E00930 [Kazachstania africana CBS 2517]